MLHIILSIRLLILKVITLFKYHNYNAKKQINNTKLNLTKNKNEIY